MPRGGTPLFDAVGKLVNLAREDNPERSALVIVTDGQENASREQTKESSRALLDACRHRGWQVIFLGADFDNFSQARDLGNQYAQTMSVASHNLAESMTSTASMRASYGATGQSMNYSEEDRKRAMKPGGGIGG
jgi:Mg-chelatase subunit ChlD